MNRPVTIALDASGGDFGPSVVVPAALDVLSKHTDVQLILAGDETAIRAELGEHTDARLHVRHATQRVEMNESPAQALRKKKDSSMRVVIDLVKSGDADACVSAGNTGALMATARYVLKTLPGIDRPAIVTRIPAIDGYTHMLDLGANVDCTAEHLYQFAVMGSELVAVVTGDPRPRVGLLNIGEEDIKGNESVKEAGQLLESSNLNYIGYVEGDDIYTDAVDVVVTDGFVGNVSLKTSEGVAKMITYYLRESFSRNALTRVVGLLAKPVLRRFRGLFDPRRYNGATLVGLQGIVIKSHGSADVFAFANAVEIAIVEVAKDLPKRIHKQLEQQFLQRETA
jgi:glycerol-3-phosphate acyltransferase PlsX